MPRTIAIGDVHGCRAELEELLSKLAPQPGDRIVFLGDLINRGPDSLGVLDIVQSLHGAVALLGNHELRMLYWRKKDGSYKFKPHDLALAQALRPKDWDFLDAMALTHFDIEKQIVFVHGGFLPNKPWPRQGAEIVTRIQVVGKDGKPYKRADCPDGTPWADLWHQGPFVIYAHTPRPSIYARATSLCIDTGCVYGGMLTAYVLPEGRLVQVPARQKYFT